MAELSGSPVPFISKESSHGASLPPFTDLNDGDKFAIILFLLAVSFYVLIFIFLYFKTHKIFKSIIPFVMYFMASGYALSPIAYMACALLKSCPTWLTSLVEPKIDIKFFIFGILAMLQYGFSGLIHTVKADCFLEKDKTENPESNRDQK